MDAPAVPGRARVLVQVSRRGVAVPRARVRFAGGLGVTGPQGPHLGRHELDLPGRFKALATEGRRYGLSGLTPVGLAATATAR